MIFRGDDFVFVYNTNPFVNYLIFDVSVLSYYSMGKDHTVLDNSTWFDLAATPDYTIFNSTFDEATIGNNRIFNVCSVKILCRAGVSGSGVDGPVIAEQSFCCFDVDERDVCIIITLEVCKRCKITSVCNRYP